MKIATWNVNSIKTLSSWHPYSDKSKFPTFNSILRSLDADIVCIQEVKSTRTKLSTDFHTLKDYNSFYCLHPSEGYCGVATFVRKSFPIPSHCELGFSGLLDPISGMSASSSSSSSSPIEGSKELVDEFGKSELLQLDGEGRCLILQWGRLVLFNVYFPATAEKESRQAFKAKFSKAVQFRVDLLVKLGYNVVVSGDLNAFRKAIDCYLIIDDKELVDYPPSIWINSWCESTMIDCLRHCHPNQTRVFTCWDLKENKRPLNDGSRIDYHLVSKNMEKSIADSFVLKDITGSDHAPVILILKEGDHKDRDPAQATADTELTRSFKDFLFGESFVAPSKPPPGCSCHWASFGDKQPKISFSKSGEKGSHDAYAPSLSSRIFGASASGQKSKIKKPQPVSKSKSSGPKQGNLKMFVKSSQFKS